MTTSSNPQHRASIEDDRRALETVCTAVRSRTLLHPDELTEVATALLRPLVRDACFGLSVTSSSADAAALWHRIYINNPYLPTITNPARAEAATLAAHHHWVHGDTKTTRGLIRQAQQLAPGHRLATLLAQGLPTLTATESRQLGMAGIVIATRLGVTLPGSSA